MKIALWGTGKKASQFVEKCKDMEIDMYIDNDVSKEGETFYGKRIVHPSKISDWNDIYIYIPSSYFEPVSKQLNSMGLMEGINYEKYLDNSVSVQQMSKDYEECMQELEKTIEVLNPKKKVFVMWGSQEGFIRKYSRDFIDAMENDGYDVVFVSESYDKERDARIKRISAPKIFRHWLYVEGASKDEKIELSIMENDLSSHVYHLKGNHEKIDWDAAVWMVYYMAQYISRVIHLLQPDIIFCMDSVTPGHELVKHIGEKNGIRLVFSHEGVIPGTMSFDTDGEMGDSVVSRYAERFKQLTVSEEDLVEAKKVISFCKTTKLNRKEQPLIPLDMIIKGIDTSRKTVFFAGQNDVFSHMVPYTNYTKKYHSPIFKDSVSAACYVANICEKNGWNFIYKPHPMYIRSSDIERLPSNTLYITQGDINSIIDVSDVVVTILSSVNYIALIRDTPVVMLGYNQICGAECVYETDKLEEIENRMKQAVEDGYTKLQRDNFVRHIAQCLKYYLYDDQKPRGFRFGKAMPKGVDELYKLKSLLDCRGDF